MRKWAERNGLLGELRALRRPVAVLLAALLAALLPLLLADFHYLDDLGRAAIGYRRWGEFGRYLSEYGSVLVHAGTHLTDISPIPQLLSALIMAMACALTLAILRPDGAKGITLWELAAALPLALSPYFLECFSYQFDAPYMAAAVLLAVAPGLLWGRTGHAVYALASVLGTLGMCVSYQAASGIYPMLVVFLTVRDWNEGKRRWRVLAPLSAASYLVGLVIFRAALMPRVDSYVATSLLPLRALPAGFFAQLVRYYRLVLSDFKKGWLALIALIFLLYAVSLVCRSKQKKPLAAAAAAAGLAAAAALAFGAYPALERPLEEPRAMLGVGALIAFAAIGACSGAKRLFPARMCCLALSWCLMVFAATYGNALAEQQRYAQFRMELVLGDLNELPIMNDGTTKVMAVSGDIGQAPALQHIPHNQGILNRLVPTVFSGGTWGENYLYSYYGMKHVAMLEDGSAVLDETDITRLGLPVVKDTMYHTIRSAGQYVVVELK